MAPGVEDAPRQRLSGLESELTVGTSASTISATRMRKTRENGMSIRRGIAAVVAATGIVCTVQTAVAGESGTFTVLSSMTTDYTTIAHAGGTVIGGASEGTSTTIESSGGPFVEGGHSHTTCVVYGRRSATGTELEAACTSTTPAGDELYLISKRSAGDVAEGGGGAGELMLMGGTGDNSGVTGTCAYEVDYLANSRYVSRAECAWQR